MKVRVVGTGQRKQVVQSEKKAPQAEKTLLDQIAQVEHLAATRRTATKQGLPRQWQEDRAARVEALRAQVRAGTYQVDSHALAELLLTENRQIICDNWEYIE